LLSTSPTTTSLVDPPSLHRKVMSEIVHGVLNVESQNWRNIWSPQESTLGEPHPQIELIESDCPEIFYGGARGGGKTDGVLGKWLKHRDRWRGNARGIVFRRRAINLEDVIARSLQLYPATGGKFIGSPRLMWQWPDGSQLRFRHLWDAKAAQFYQGHAYTYIVIEEAQQWPDPEPIKLIGATLRSAHGVSCEMLLTGNPGGPGHHWVKARYVDPAPQGFEEHIDPVTGQGVMFIPAKLEDNPKLVESDPTYERRLMASSNSQALIKAWRYGAWDVIAGAFFSDVWRPEKQRLKWFEIPASWGLLSSFDWGFAKPSALGLYAISSGEPLPKNSGCPYPGRVFPKGTFIRIGEVYTAERDQNGILKPNQGARIVNARLGRLVEEAREEIAPSREWRGYADPSIFDESGGKSIYRQMTEGTQLKWLGMMKADNTRIAGWGRVREMLSEAASDHPEGPGLYWFEGNCREFERTMPLLPMDEKKPDDVDTDAEDHIGDEVRYAVMSYKTMSSTEFRQ